MLDVYRAEILKADKVLYVVDNRQASHFKSVFDVIHKLNYDKTEFKHIDFGTILGTDKKPFKTRSGNLITLEELIDEAEVRATELIEQRWLQNQHQRCSDNKKLAHQIAIGVLKYADLSKNRSKDFVFDWDNLLSFNGDSSVYLQYTAVRINKILNDFYKNHYVITKENQLKSSLLDKVVQIQVKQMQFDEIVQSCLKDHKLNYLCDYLQNLCGLFNNLYNEPDCRFIEEGTMNQKYYEILSLMKQILNIGLTKILGIEIPEMM